MDEPMRVMGIAEECLRVTRELDVLGARRLDPRFEGFERENVLAGLHQARAHWMNRHHFTDAQRDESHRWLNEHAELSAIPPLSDYIERHVA